MYDELIPNISLLVALSTLYGIVLRVPILTARPRIQNLVTGLLFGGVTIIGMTLPFVYAPGIIYDGRSIVLCLAVFFGGWEAGMLAGAMAAGYRIALGGSGMMTGVMVIISSVVIGAIFRWHYRNQPWQMPTQGFLYLGVTVHLTMLLLMLTLPWPVGLTVIERMAVPIMVFYPLGTLVLGMFLSTEIQRFQAMIQLRRANEFTENLIQTANVIFVQLNTEGEVVRINKQGEDIIGYHFSELQGKNWFEIIVPKDRYPDVWDYFVRLTANGQILQHFQNPILTKSGEERHILWQNSVLTQEQTVGGTISFGMDITDLVMAKEHIRKLQDRFETFMDHIPAAVFMKDKHSRYTYVNRYMKETFGGHHWLGQSPFEHFSENIARQIIADDQAVLDRGIREVEETLKDKDGNERVLRTVKFRMNPSDSETWIGGIAWDITQRKAAEQALDRLNRELELRVARRTEELEAANRELEAFAYSVSHDLRAPLRAIGGFAEILSKRYRDSLDAKANHYLDNILEATERMGDLISDLLDYSRLGKNAMVLKPVPLYPMIQNILEELKSVGSQANARFQVASDLPVIKGNSTLVWAIFSNLIQNALIYRKPDVPANVTIDWEDANDQVVVRVADNGIGIDPEYIDKIFNIFQRLHSRSIHPGTGIGLAIVKKAVKLLDGQVGVDSTPGQGTVFRLRLPKWSESQPDQTDSQQSKVMHGVVDSLNTD